VSVVAFECDLVSMTVSWVVYTRGDARESSACTTRGTEKEPLDLLIDLALAYFRWKYL